MTRPPEEPAQPSLLSPAQLADVLAASPDGMLACSKEGTVLCLNRQAEHLLGLSCTEAEGRRLVEDLALFPPGCVEGWMALACQPDESPSRRSDGLCESLVTLQPRTGRRMTCRVRAVCLKGESGESAGICIFLRDVGDVTQLQEALGDAREQFKALVDRATDVIFQVKPNMVVQYVNPALRTMLGQEPSDWIGRRLELPLVLPPEEIRRLGTMGARKIFREGLRGKLFRVHRKNGTLFWGLLSLAPLRQGGSLRSLMGILRDVSEFYATREQLEYQHAQLKRTVTQLEEAYRLQEQFVANVTHELRTPLTTILITAEVLEKSLADEVPPAQKRQVELIHRNSLLLLDIINDLLDLARLKRDGFRIQEAEVPLKEFVQSLMEAVEPLFQRKSLFLKSHLAPGTPAAVRTDPQVLRKILTNLLSNACKFTESGGAMLVVELDGAWLKMAVADTGIGIPSEELASIFEEFRQIDGSDARHYPGTGLGLSIAQRFAALLRGRLEVESVPGQGSRFTLLLPLRAGSDSHQQ